MYSKKLITALLVLGVGASTYALSNQINKKGVFGETIEQNVVYAKSDSSTVSKNSTDLSNTEDEAIKEKSAEILKKYYNISLSKDSNYDSVIISENTLNELDDREADIDGLKGTLEKLKHGVIQTTWIDGNKCYIVFFNESTKEAEFVIGDRGDGNPDTLAISEDELKNTAEDFIRENKLGNLEKPKCILVRGDMLFYQDENDPNKKVGLTISPNTKKVYMFSIKAYADMLYDETANIK